MKTEEEFKDYYNTVLLEKAKLLEGLRVTTKRNLTAFYILCGIVLLCSLIAIGYMFYYLNQLIADHNRTYSIGGRQYKAMGGIIAFIAFINTCLFFYAQNIKRGYRLSFRKHIIMPMLDFYNKGLTYMPEKEMPYKAIAASNLFNNMGEYEARDYMEGKIGKRFIQLAVLNLSRSIDSAEDAFKGLILITPLQAAPLKDLVNIYSWKHSSFHVDIPFKDTMKLEPLKYGSDEFQKEFTVFASDKSLLPGLLSGTITEWMLNLKKQSNTKFCISFTRNSMFLAIQSNSSIFEPAIKKPVNPEDVFDWAHSFHIAVQAIADFDAAKKAASSSI